MLNVTPDSLGTITAPPGVITAGFKPLVEDESRAINGTVGDITANDPRMTARNVNVYYGDKLAINNVSLEIGKNEVVAMIGPSGCGKSTFLRCLNRMNDTIDICRVEGEIRWMTRISMTVVWMWCRCAPRWGWCFRNPTRSLSRSMTMWPMDRASTV